MIEDITIARTSQNHGKKHFRISPEGSSPPAPCHIHFDLRWGANRHPGGGGRLLFQGRTLIGVSLIRVKTRRDKQPPVPSCHNVVTVPPTRQNSIPHLYISW